MEWLCLRLWLCFRLCGAPAVPTSGSWALLHLASHQATKPTSCLRPVGAIDHSRKTNHTKDPRNLTHIWQRYVNWLKHKYNIYMRFSGGKVHHHKSMKTEPIRFVWNSDFRLSTCITVYCTFLLTDGLCVKASSDPVWCFSGPKICTRGSCTYYVITDRGRSSQMITVLHRGGPANDYNITWGWWVKWLRYTMNLGLLH